MQLSFLAMPPIGTPAKNTRSVCATLGVIAAACLLSSPGAQAAWHFLGDTSSVVSYELLTPDATYSHPSNPFESRDGTLMIVSVMGASEGEDTDIGLYRDAGSGWGTPVIVAGPGALFDPTLVQTDDGTMYCFYYDGCCDDQKYRTSTDDGVTWGAEHDVNGNDDIGFAEQNNAKRHPNGDWFAMESTKNPTGVGMDAAGDAMYVVVPKGELGNSDNWLQTTIRSGWSTGDFLVVSPGETINGHYKHLRAVMRCDFNCEGQGSFAYSDDAGQSWNIGYDIPFNGIPRCGDLAEVHAPGQSTRSAWSLDVEGGPLQGWHVIATSAKTAYCDAIGAAGVPAKWERGSIAILRSNTGNHDDFHEAFLVRETGSGPENADPGMIRSADGMLHVTFTGRDAVGIRHVVIDAPKLVGNNATSAREQQIAIAGDVSTRHASVVVGEKAVHVTAPTGSAGTLSVMLLDLRGRPVGQATSRGNTATLRTGGLSGMFLLRTTVDGELRYARKVRLP